MKTRGNCYVACEALYHLLGGKQAGYKPMRVKHEVDTHWFLVHQSGLRIDPTASQFKKAPPYDKAVGCGFLTKKPSKRAEELMGRMVWQD